jgi:hypothetical protein
MPLTTLVNHQLMSALSSMLRSELILACLPTSEETPRTQMTENRTEVKSASDGMTALEDLMSDGLFTLKLGICPVTDTQRTPSLY